MSNKREELSILVVDDMKFNCEFIRRALVGEGYSDIRVAESASQALLLLQERRVDVLLADWVMPEMDGLELVERVRQLDEESNHYTCILLLTARDDIDSVIEAFDRGVDDYLTKPPNKQELAARIYAAGRMSTLHNNLLDSVASMRTRYEQHATVDPLTGLGNRNDAARRLKELLSLVNSRGGAVCCGVLRIHRANELMEQYGKKVYEEVLTGITRRLSRIVRPNDVLARISEEEFVIGMYYGDVEHVKVKNYKRILQGINLRQLKTSVGFIGVNVAIGMSCNRAGDPLITSETLINSASDKVKISQKTGCTEIGV